MSNPLPAELARLLHAGDPAERDEAWAGLVRSCTNPILRVARSLGGDHDAVMDRYAFVLERLRDDDYRRLRAYDRPGAGEFGLWLLVVARRLCLDHYRHRYGRPRPRPGHGAEANPRIRRHLVDLMADRVDPAALPDPSSAAPDTDLERAERARKLESAIGTLAPRDRLLIRLRFDEELSAREITALMQFPTLFHVYRRLDVVLRSLRHALRSAGLEEVDP